MRTPEEWREEALRRGYEIDEQDETKPWLFWVVVGKNSWRLVDMSLEDSRAIRYGKAPNVIFENTFANGRFKYVTHGLPDDREPPCIEDYADETGAKYWKDYVTIKSPDGRVLREGPKPFRSKKERREYENLTGQRQRDKGEKDHRGSCSW